MTFLVGLLASRWVRYALMVFALIAVLGAGLMYIRSDAKDEVYQEIREEQVIEFNDTVQKVERAKRSSPREPTAAREWLRQYTKP